MIFAETKLDVVALVVSIIVIFFMTIIFLSLFLLNNALRKKIIIKGVDDETFAKQLQKSCVPSENNPKTKDFYQNYLKKQTRGQKVLSVLSNAIFGVLIAILLVCFTFAAIFRANGGFSFS